MASDDNNEMHGHIRAHMNGKSTEELQFIYTENDQEQYTSVTFEIIGQILDERGASREVVDAVDDVAADDTDGAEEHRQFGSVVEPAGAESGPVSSPPTVDSTGPPAPPSDSPGFWGDYFSFRKMISIAWIKFMYVLGAFGIIIGSLIIVVRAAEDGEPGWFLGALLLLVFGNLAWRLTCETAIVFFGIHEALVSIDRKTKG